MENFWSLFKRGVIGSFHHAFVKHLHRYLNEFSFRFNEREYESLLGLIITNLVKERRSATSRLPRRLPVNRPRLPKARKLYDSRF